MATTASASSEEPDYDKPRRNKGKRRSRGDGGLHWDEKRRRWIATITIGYTPAGKRITRKGSGRTKTEAKNKLKENLRDHEDGLAVAPHNYTVADAVRDWLQYGLVNRDEDTVVKCRSLAQNHIIPELGARKLRELSADDVDRWLGRKAKSLSTDTLRQLRSILKRAINRAQARDKVKRNVVLLCEVPQGKEGRPSKSLTIDQAAAVIRAAERTAMYAYIVLSLLVGARTEELRALTWAHVDLEGRPDAEPPVPPSIRVWRSVRRGGKTKTKKSRRTLALPKRCVEALRFHRDLQAGQREKAGTAWKEHGLVFASAVGTERNANNVLRSFRTVLKKTDLDPDDWTPREMRHSFVSVLSDAGVPIEEISRLAGHKSTEVTETVYWHQIRPALLGGAEAMDEVFPEEDHEP
ncbi:site-specific integrase [Actinomadura sp. KC216]|uniref:site-specific integrase n=1 Tax=Actinomadura sp. KC216 TaxID=2530370 RepID=UPI00104A92C0|nr:site-specific integrase [Actinomadura sp. KC216]TDB89984.1 site-specific integrase [Actinomadura sp. KC216]